MRDVLVSCRVLDTLVAAVGLLCGAWSVSYPQRPHRRRHGCTVGIDWDPPVCRSHPGRKMGTSQRAWLAWLCVWSHWLVYGGGCFYRQSGVSARTLPRPTPCGEGVGRPCRLHPSTRTQHCTGVAAGFLTASTLQWPSGLPLSTSTSVDCSAAVLCFRLCFAVLRLIQPPWHCVLHLRVVSLLMPLLVR